MSDSSKSLYFSGNLHLLKYNICGWLICGEWKIADVVIKKVGDNPFYSYMILSETLWKHLAEIDEECNEMMERPAAALTLSASPAMKRSSGNKDPPLH